MDFFSIKLFTRLFSIKFDCLNFLKLFSKYILKIILQSMVVKKTRKQRSTNDKNNKTKAN